MPKAEPAPDFDSLLAGISQVGGPRLRINDVLAKLPDDQRPKVERALRDPAISASRVAKALVKMGKPYAASEGAVATWRERNGIT